MSLNYLDNFNIFIIMTTIVIIFWVLYSRKKEHFFYQQLSTELSSDDYNYNYFYNTISNDTQSLVFLINLNKTAKKYNFVTHTESSGVFEKFDIRYGNDGLINNDELDKKINDDELKKIIFRLEVVPGNNNKLKLRKITEIPSGTTIPPGSVIGEFSDIRFIPRKDKIYDNSKDWFRPFMIVKGAVDDPEFLTLTTNGFEFLNIEERNLLDSKIGDSIFFFVSYFCESNNPEALGYTAGRNCICRYLKINNFN